MAPPTRHAVLLAAGRARRLRPLTDQRPKGMLLVGGKPLLQHLQNAVAAHGVQRIVIVTGPHPETIQSFFKDGADFDLPIEYAHQDEPTGTADAVRHATAHLDDDADVLIIPGDNYLTPQTLNGLLDIDGDTLLLAHPQSDEEYGLPTLKGDRLTGLKDQPVPDRAQRVSTGVIQATPTLLQALDEPQYAELHDLDDFLNAYAQDGHHVRVVDAAGPWEDVTTPWDLLRLNEHILDQLPTPDDAAGAVHVAATATVSPTARLIGPVTIADGAQIGDFTVIGPYVSIRSNTTIGSHCEIRRAILNNNVTVESRATLRGSILDDGVHLATGFHCHEESTPNGLVGCVIGHDAEIGPDGRAESGVLVEPETKVPAATRLAAPTRAE